MIKGSGTNVLMDVDTGVDDAMALALAVRSPDLNLVGVTTVAGNVNLEQATNNTLRVLDALGAAETPVHKGMNRPLIRTHFDATHFHGHDGIGHAPFPEPTRQPDPVTAPEFIVRCAREYDGELTLLFVGPLTNLAVALALEPDLPRLVDRTVIMGGAFDVPGNATPYAEFNIAVDPEAAMLVAESGLHATWIGLDVTHLTMLYRADWDLLENVDAPPAMVVREVCRQSFAERGHDYVYLHDPLAVGVVIEPDLVRCEHCAVWVDTTVRETAGATRMVTDSRAPQHEVASQVRSGLFRQRFGDILGLPVSQTASGFE